MSEPGHRLEKGKKKNQDYANHGPTLAHSLRYVAKDLEVLKPDLLILPHTIYNALGKRRPLLVGFPPTSTVVCQWNSIHRPQAGCG